MCHTHLHVCRHGFERKSRKQTYREDPYVFLPRTETVVQSIR